jgi:hypothetical protein
VVAEAGVGLNWPVAIDGEGEGAARWLPLRLLPYS